MNELMDVWQGDVGAIIVDSQPRSTALQQASSADGVRSVSS